MSREAEPERRAGGSSRRRDVLDAPESSERRAARAVDPGRIVRAPVKAVVIPDQDRADLSRPVADGDRVFPPLADDPSSRLGLRPAAPTRSGLLAVGCAGSPRDRPLPYPTSRSATIPTWSEG